MAFLQNKKRKRLIIWLTSITLVIVILFGAGLLYLNDYYKAQDSAIHAFTAVKEAQITEDEDGNLIFKAKKERAGFIFYPGGKVEQTAYKPLMALCAEKGITCILLKMPFHLAVLDKNGADGVKEKFPAIKRWYIGGHSLGGAMSASYVLENASDFDGLILLGAYSTANLSKTNLKVLSIYGSEDKVLDKEKYDECKANLPKNFTEHVIDGGCHAYFGMYGKQDGDGTPTITVEKQLEETAKQIEKFIFG